MTVVVTGASGHVGANLVRELVRRGRKVRAVLETGRADAGRTLEGLEVEQVRADVRVPESLRARALISVDADSFPSWRMALDRSINDFKSSSNDRHDSGTRA